MVFSVAAQGDNAASANRTSHFFPGNGVTRAVAGALHIDKAAIVARAKAASVAGSDDEGVIARIIEAIRQFLARICRSFVPARSGHLSNSDNSLKSAGIREVEAPIVTETADEFRVEGLPEPSLDRVRQTVEQLVDSADGASLPNSLRSALAMPELGRRQAFRVLLQQNIGDTVHMREVSTSLRQDIQRMVEPFAREHGIETDAALALFRADLEGGGGVIANRVDPNSELRGHVAELKKLESALAGLARHRGVICANAIEGGGYTREEIAALVAQQGFDTEFLFEAEAQATHPVKTDVENNEAAHRGNVVSLATYRGQEQAAHADYPPAATAKAVSAAITHLVEEGVIDLEPAEEIENAAAVDAALSDESEFETELHGDNFGDFLKNRDIPKPTMKP